MSDSPTRDANTAEPRRRPDVRPVPQLVTTNSATGATDHAAERLRWRGKNAEKHAVRRAWSDGGELDPGNLGCDDEPDAARYDPLTETVLIAREGTVTTVIDATCPTLRTKIADELKMRGYL